MSAFMVSNSTINTISCMTGVPAQSLIDMNARAILARYGVQEGWEAHGEGTKVPLGVLAKLLSCYLYQCSEGDVPEEGLFKVLDAYRDNLSQYEGTPEYEAAPWG